VKRTLGRLTLALFGLGFGLVAAEVGVRVYYPDGGIPAAHLESSSAEEHTTVHEDAEAGYLPVLGRGEYDTYGCLKNDYDVAHRQGTRLLFVGDSVTHRAKLVNALRKLYGEDNYEYWNAGVESFNTRQELVLYRRHNAAIQPDHVILTFHNNDFRATPLVVREKGQFKVYDPGMSLNPWLFERSYLYRWAWPRTDDRQGRARQVLESLGQFKALLAQQKVRFSIVLVPMFKPVKDWDKSEAWSRQQSQEYFRQLNLTYFDMLPVMEQALQEGKAITETPGDFFHPNDFMAQRFAQDLHRQGLLEGP
jgi:hypothetical protein